MLTLQNPSDNPTEKYIYVHFHQNTVNNVKTDALPTMVLVNKHVTTQKIITKLPT